ncbi:hypothetical protein PVAG01_11124 [Phlyctema vagabunda]|uniref:Uncharacterized protein n=1 Tax=Phlyctema vagabunda TaxID=108571 RepID=A0ABR4P1D6_9HELO
MSLSTIATITHQISTRDLTPTKVSWPTMPACQWQQPELSVGVQNSRHFGLNNKCWTVRDKSPAHEALSTILKEATILLEEQFEHLETCGAELMVEIFMIGRKPTKCRPTVLISCNNKTARQNAMRLLDKRGILAKYPGVVMAESSRLPRPLALDDISSDPVLDPGVYINGDTDSAGLSILIKKATGGDVAQATLGGFLFIDNVVYGLTAAHPFEESSPAQHEREEDSSDSEFAFYGGDDFGDSSSEDEDLYETTSRASMSSISTRSRNTNEHTSESGSLLSPAASDVWSEAEAGGIPSAKAKGQREMIRGNSSHQVSSSEAVSKSKPELHGNPNNYQKLGTMYKSTNGAAPNRNTSQSVEDLDREIYRLDKVVNSGQQKILEEKKALVEISNLRKQNNTLSSVKSDQKGHGLTSKIGRKTLDWALIRTDLQESHFKPFEVPPSSKMEEARMKMKEKPFNRFNQRNRIVTSTASEPADRPVYVSVGTYKFPLRGNLSGTSSFTIRSETESFQELWSITLEDGYEFDEGHCGSWVTDCETGKWYGQIVSGFAGSKTGYIVPAYQILRDIGEVLNSPVHFISQDFRVIEKSRILKAKESRKAINPYISLFAEGNARPSVELPDDYLTTEFLHSRKGKASQISEPQQSKFPQPPMIVTSDTQPSITTNASKPTAKLMEEDKSFSNNHPDPQDATNQVTEPASAASSAFDGQNLMDSSEISPIVFDVTTNTVQPSANSLRGSVDGKQSTGSTADSTKQDRSTRTKSIRKNFKLQTIESPNVGEQPITKKPSSTRDKSKADSLPSTTSKIPSETPKTGISHPSDATSADFAKRLRQPYLVQTVSENKPSNNTTSQPKPAFCEEVDDKTGEVASGTKVTASIRKQNSANTKAKAQSNISTRISTTAKDRQVKERPKRSNSLPRQNSKTGQSTGPQTRPPPATPQWPPPLSRAMTTQYSPYGDSIPAGYYGSVYPGAPPRERPVSHFPNYPPSSIVTSLPYYAGYPAPQAQQPDYFRPEASLSSRSLAARFDPVNRSSSAQGMRESRIRENQPGPNPYPPDAESLVQQRRTEDSSPVERGIMPRRSSVSFRPNTTVMNNAPPAPRRPRSIQNHTITNIMQQAQAPLDIVVPSFPRVYNDTTSYYGTPYPGDRSDRSTYNPRTTYVDRDGHHIEVASSSRRRQSYHSQRAIDRASDYQSQVLGDYRPEPLGLSPTPLTAESLRRRGRRAHTSSSSQSTDSYQSSEWSRRSATTRTTMSDIGDDEEDFVIKVSGDASIVVGGTPIQVKDGGEVQIRRRPSSTDRGGQSLVSTRSRSRSRSRRRDSSLERIKATRRLRSRDYKQPPTIKQWKTAREQSPDVQIRREGFEEDRSFEDC